MIDLSRAALGSWSGGRFMHFGEPLADDRLLPLLTPDERLSTVITADVYGVGGADLVVGQALAGRERDSFQLVGTVGHDFYTGERDGSKGFPRFTAPGLREPAAYADYLRMATEKSLERCGVDHFDTLLLHNPDRTGYTSEVVWSAMAALKDEGLTRGLGIAPGPANGFALDIITCVERFGSILDWAMIILNPFEPWPGSYTLGAMVEHDVRVIARVIDYGGIFWDDVPDEDALGRTDHRTYRPAGWVQSGRDRLAQLRPIAERHGLTPLQLSCQWTLAQPAVHCVVPTLIQEAGPQARPVEAKREELASIPAGLVLDAEEIAAIRRIGDNHGSMALKGGSPVFAGEPLPDQWPLFDDLRDVASRWGIAPERDLVKAG
jgi:aryl-alcohol dehydrogenase-like predicted oxidoreductase